MTILSTYNSFRGEKAFKINGKIPYLKINLADNFEYVMMYLDSENSEQATSGIAIDQISKLQFEVINELFVETGL